MTDPIEQPIVVAPTEAPADPGYSHDDLQKQSIREIAEGQTPAPAAEVAIPPEEEEISVDELKTQIREDLKKEQQAEFEKRQQEEEAKKQAQEKITPKEQIYLDWEKKFAAENHRPPTYLEALSFVEEQAIVTIEERQLQKQKLAEEERQKALETQQAEEKKLNNYVDDELNDLYNAGKLTKIQDPNNPSDQGVLERRALFQAWQEVNADRRSKGLPEIISATRIYEFYYKKPSAQPPGADAPIFGNRGSGTPPSEEQSYSYTDLKKPWSFFRRSQ